MKQNNSTELSGKSFPKFTAKTGPWTPADPKSRFSWIFPDSPGHEDFFNMNVTWHLLEPLDSAIYAHLRLSSFVDRRRCM